MSSERFEKQIAFEAWAMKSRRFSTTTSWPRRPRSSAMARPTGPAPTMTTRALSVAEAGAGVAPISL